MNSKERVKWAFAHREADRVPTFELTIDNPTAAHVLGRDTLCGFGGRVRGLLQNQALIEGRFHEYHQQRVADEIELWRALDLDVYPNATPVPKNPAIPEQISETEWRVTHPGTGQWTLYRYAPESDTYDEVDSSLKQGGLAELERLTDWLEANPSRLEDWDFTPVDTFIHQLGADRFVMGSADVEIGSTFCWAEHFLLGLYDAPELIHRYLDARLQTALLLLEAGLERSLVLLTNVPLTSGEVARSVYDDWRLRSRIEHGYRFDQEQGLDVEDMRVQTLERMKRLFFLVLAAAQFVFYLIATWPPRAVH